MRTSSLYVCTYPGPRGQQCRSYHTTEAEAQAQQAKRGGTLVLEQRVLLWLKGKHARDLGWDLYGHQARELRSTSCHVRDRESLVAVLPQYLEAQAARDDLPGHLQTILREALAE